VTGEIKNWRFQGQNNGMNFAIRQIEPFQNPDKSFQNPDIRKELERGMLEK